MSNKNNMSWDVIWNDDLGWINFYVDNKLALHFNIRYSSTVMNSYDKNETDWGQEISINTIQFHSEQRPLKFTISFNIIIGFIITYKGNIIAKFPNRLNVTDSNSFRILTSSSNIQITPVIFKKLDNVNCIMNRGTTPRVSSANFKYIGDFDSYEQCAQSPNIDPNAKAITYHKDNAGGWSKQCYSVSDSYVKTPNQDYATCGISVNNKKDYGMILAVGMDSRLYSIKTLSDNLKGPIENSCCIDYITEFNNGTIVALAGAIVWLKYKNNITSTWYAIPETCCIISITQLDDNTIVGIGLDHKIWTKKYLTEKWSKLPNQNSFDFMDICQLNDGSIIAVGTNHKLYKTNDIKNLQWEGPIDNSCCIISITQLDDDTILGIGIDNLLYLKNDINEKWTAPISDFKIKSIVQLKKQNKNFKQLNNVNCIMNRGTTPRVSSTNFKYIGDFDSYEQCAQSPNIDPNAKAITYHKDNAGGWSKQCYSVNDTYVETPNQNYAVCGIKYSKKHFQNGLIVGIGVDNNIYTKTDINKKWQGPINNSCCMSDIIKLNKGPILGVGIDSICYIKNNINDEWKLLDRSCCVKSVAQLKDGTILGIGLNNMIWKKNNLNEYWQGPIVNSCCVIDITQLNDGTIIGVQPDNYLYKKMKITDPWIGPIDKSHPMLAITQLNDGTILGAGTDNFLYKKNNITEKWIGPMIILFLL
jgi:predicted HNH restriction endonuclease